MAEEMNITPEETTGKKENSAKQNALLYLHDLLYMLAGIMLVFLLLFRMVIVSGSSMYGTLWNGDWLLVLSNTVYREPKQGDIIVACKDSFNDGEAIIKRVIATEGQVVNIDFQKGIVYVDSRALDEPYTFTATNYDEGMEFPLTVQEGCIFAMGDNRNSSIDSRYPGIGLIDTREILGKAVFLIYPGNGERDNWAPKDYDRIGAMN